MSLRLFLLVLVLALPVLGEQRSRQVASREMVAYNDTFKIGPVFNVDVLWGSVAYSGELSTGLGFAGGIQARIGLADSFFVSITPGLQISRLGRQMTGTGILSDPPIEFTQNIKYLGLQVISGVRFDRTLVDEASPFPVEWWFELGIQYLYPISANQSDSAGGDIDFDSKDRPLYVLLGPSVTYPLSLQWGIEGDLHLFYNLSSANSSRLFGVRFAVAVHLCL